MIRHRQRAVTLMLAALLLFAPLAFGGALGWAETAIELALALLLAAVAVLEWPVAAWGRALRVAAGACFGLGGFAFLQSVSWPEGLVGLVSPRHLELWRQARTLVPAGGGGIALSLAPDTTRSAGLAFLAVGAALLVGAAAGSSRPSRRWLGGAIAGAALFQVLYGAPRWMSHTQLIWGIEAPGEVSRLRGTFVNANHFALSMELALAVAFAALWWGVRRSRREPALERRIALVALPGLLWLMIFAALVFSGSRAGLISAMTATAVQGAALAAARRRWRLAPLGLGLALAGVLVTVALGAREGQGRALAASTADASWTGRVAAWRATLELWREFPATGAGLGTFADAFPLVQPESMRGYWTHAHNDGLELLALAGPLGVAAAGLAVFVVARGLGRRLRTEGLRSEARAAVVAALGALVAAAVHEMFDFGLTLPANALTLAVICGAALAAGVAPANGEGKSEMSS
jgi:O-antigen ligase